MQRAAKVIIWVGDDWSIIWLSNTRDYSEHVNRHPVPSLYTFLYPEDGIRTSKRSSRQIKSFEHSTFQTKDVKVTIMWI